MAVTFITLVFVFVMSIGGVTSEKFKAECVSGHYPPPASTKVPSYVVNLDLAPEKRWAPIVKERRDDIVNLLTKLKEFLRSFGRGSKAIIYLIENDIGFLADTFPHPFGDEIKGIAKVTGIPLGEIVLYNMFYEVFTVCTSIVAEDSNGKLFHARNMDFGLFLGWDVKNNTWAITEALRPMIVSLDFQKNGKTVFKSANFVGYIGVLTAIKPKVFTLSMDERFNVDGGYIGLFKWLLGDRTGRWMGFLTRSVMEHAPTYAVARTKLARTPMLAPAYFILGGNQSGEACVVTRSRAGAVNIWEMDKSAKNSSSWYLLETNYDHWEKPFVLDDRRTPGNRCMRKKTQKGVSFAGLFDVLSSRPVLNKLTAYTALMQVNSGSLEVYLRYCHEPCIPW